MSARPPQPPRAGRCLLCGRPRRREFRPFCSRRCRDLDLMSWLDGRYAVPAVEVDEDGSEARRREDD